MITLDFIRSKVRIDEDTGCHVWLGSKDKDGYARHTSARPIKCVRLHREVYKLTYGEFDVKLLVCHKCDNPSCVNPEHLFLGTVQDNNLDKWLKRRQVNIRGENSHAAVLTDESVGQIRKMYWTDKVTQAKIAAKFGVSRPHISLVVNYKIWTHLK